MRRLRSASSASVAWYLNGRIEVSPPCCATAAAEPMMDVSTAAGAVAPGSVSVCAPGGVGGVVAEWAGLIGRRRPTEPTIVEARKWRRAMGRRSAGMVLLLGDQAGRRFARPWRMLMRNERAAREGQCSCRLESVKCFNVDQ